MRPIHILLAAAATVASAQNAPTTTSQYVDPATGISFQSFSTAAGYRFGMVLPQGNASDLIIQLVSPLRSGSGWAGVDFGNRMLGPLLIVAWPNGNDIILAPRVASGYRPADCTPYTARPLDLKPIARGTFVNSTHLSATFICGGCINADSFDPRSSATQAFAYAYSLATVSDPGNRNVQLPAHNLNGETYGPFGVDVAGARSADYSKFAALAEAGSPTGTGTGTSTGTGTGGAPAGTAAGGGVSSGQGTSQAGETEYDKMSPGAVVGLAFVGLLYILQAFSVF